jgi:hypothetical protein
MINQAKILKLQDLINKIDDVDKMVKHHATDSSDFMLRQYEAKKEKLLGYLIDELINSSVRSHYSFKLISMALNKYYPDLNTKVEEDKNYLKLKEIEDVLV